MQTSIKARDLKWERFRTDGLVASLSIIVFDVFDGRGIHERRRYIKQRKKIIFAR
jgi:hypothetical protein